MGQIINDLTKTYTPTSGKNELNKLDWQRWLRNLLLFSIPTIISLLYALQGYFTNTNHLPTSDQIMFAVGGAYQTLVASLIDLLLKYKKSS